MTTFAKQTIYIGTYTHAGEDETGRSEGIYRCTFDVSTAKLQIRCIVQDVVNPSFLALSKDRQYLFAVNELAQSADFPEGSVSAFRIDQERAQIAFLNKQPSHGSDPCYISLDATEHWALVANYSSGSVAVFPVGNDGQLGSASDVIQNHGHSVNPQRQKSPHPHCVAFDPSQRYVLVADLGLDQILIYRFDGNAGRLLPDYPAAVSAAPGAGPRHLEFHPDGRYLYVTNELDSTVSVYAWDSDRPALAPVTTISSLPSDFAGANKLADLHVTRDGRFLYASNRGHDSIAAFAIDPTTGLLTLLEIVSSGGRSPRNFALDLTGHYLLAANQHSHTLVVFRRDTRAGSLTQVGAPTSIPSPVCVQVVCEDPGE